MHCVTDHDDPDHFLGVTELSWCSLAAALRRAEQPGSTGPEDLGG